MKLHHLFSAALVPTLAAVLASSSVVRAAPASGLSQAVPSVRVLEAPEAQPGVENAYYRHYYHRHYRHYYHPYYHRYYHRYYRRYYRPYYHRYYHRHYYHRFYY